MQSSLIKQDSRSLLCRMLPESTWLKVKADICLSSQAECCQYSWILIINKHYTCTIDYVVIPEQLCSIQNTNRWI